MGLTKEQAMVVSEVWFRIDNPRHPKTGEIRHARRNGATKTWKRDPDRFSLPVKYGLYECFRVDEGNCHQFFASREECEQAGKG